MTAALLGTEPLRRTYGFWGSTLWTLAAFFLSVVATFAVLTIHTIAAGDPSRRLPVGYIVTLSCIALIAVLVWAVRRTRWPFVDYFALVRPSNLHVAVAIIGAIGIGFVEQALLSALGDAETSSRAALKLYWEARSSGLLPLYWFNTILLAPATEELVFRGFLLPSWAKSRLGCLGATLVTSVLFALMHLQYDWRGMVAIGLLGVFCAWLRMRSGSLIPSIVAHVSGNLLATIGAALSL